MASRVFNCLFENDIGILKLTICYIYSGLMQLGFIKFFIEI